MRAKKNIDNYLGSGANRFFKIPAYQRGFKWGQLRADNRCDASQLVLDIIDAMKCGKAEYFIQGVTVYEEGFDVVLIDGQQRTTTLFLLLVLLMNETESDQYLFCEGNFKLKYDIRIASQQFLENRCRTGEFAVPNSQDEYLMKQASDEMKKCISTEIKADLKEYLLYNVQLFYIEVPKQQATQVFSMLNGSKAFMTADELIKSSFLSEATKMSDQQFESKSLDETLENLKSQIGNEWHTTAVRSKYARQWDKWLYWWNKPLVRAFYSTPDNPMGRLLEYYYKFESTNTEDTKYSNKPSKIATVFKLFQNEFIQDKESAKASFEKLRKLQKTFEDLYNSTELHNYLGLTLAHTKPNEVLKTLNYFVQYFKSIEKLKRYSLLATIGITHTALVKDELDNDNRLDLSESVKNFIDSLKQPYVYTDDDAKENAFRCLLMLNVLASSDRNCKFEFFYRDKGKITPFYSNRSLEHIWPKSKVRFKNKDDESSYLSIDEKGNEITAKADSKTYINRSDFDKSYSEHCLGNLLLLHSTDNSIFNAKLPEAKKLVYFDLKKEIYSRNLLHTMSAFAIENWGIENAIKNIQKLREKTVNDITTKLGEYVK